MLSKLYTHCGAWAHNPRIKSRELYWRGQPGAPSTFSNIWASPANLFLSWIDIEKNLPRWKCFIKICFGYSVFSGHPEGKFRMATYHQYHCHYRVLSAGHRAALPPVTAMSEDMRWKDLRWWYDTENETPDTWGKWRGMRSLKETSMTDQPFFIGWYNSGWVSSRKENNKKKNSTKRRLRKKMASFKIPLLEFLYNVNRTYSSLKTCLKYPMNRPTGKTHSTGTGRQERKK